MKIDRFVHNDTQYEFEPPIDMPDDVRVLDIAHLVSIALMNAQPYLVPEVANKLQMSTATAVRSELESAPDLALTTLQGALKGKHSVKAVNY